MGERKKRDAAQHAARVMEQRLPREKVSAAALRGQLRRSLAKMKRMYRERLEEKEKSPAAMWLCDNFYVLEKETKQTLRECGRGAKLPALGKLPQLYRVCAAVLQARPALNTELLAELIETVQQYRDLSIPEFDFLPLALRAVLLETACAACSEDAGAEDISYAVTSLTQIYAVDFDALVCKYSVVEAVFNKDPCGAYPNMEKESRGGYRALAGLIAQRTGRTERAVAEALLEKAQAGKTERERHIGYALLEHPVLTRERRRRGAVLLWGTPTLALALSATAGLLAGGLQLLSLGVGAVCFLPLWEASRFFVERCALSGARLALIPRMSREACKKESCETVVAVSVLVPPSDSAPRLAKHLEELYHSNPHEELSFCLLADFKEKDTPVAPEDESAMRALAKEIRRLNERWGNRFSLFVRGRVYCKTQRRFCGWERKRGAITELIRAMKGDVTSEILFEGDRTRLQNARFVLALDSDTELLFDSAIRLISAAVHPLGRPVVDERRGVVTAGYGIFAPVMATTLESHGRTPFSRMMSGIGGTAAYDTARRDVYQDLFGEALFAGKGLIDADCFYRVMNTRLPENLVLSHDSLESAILRTAVVTDVELTDSFPGSAGAWLSRLHRWVRGDWQNLRWIFGRTPIGNLSRWKLADNLRRSLTPVAELGCIGLAMALPERAALVLAWSVLLSEALAPVVSAALAALSGGLRVLSRRFFTRALPQALGQLSRVFYALVMLPQTALRCLNAACVALYRQFISRRNLLQWVPAADCDGASGFLEAVRRFWPGEVVGLAVLLLSPYGFLRLFGVLFCLVIPFAALTGRPYKRAQHSFETSERERLLGYCAAMWRFFETYVTKDEHFLPPDNVQEAPVYAVARRTSPTNIGLYLLCILAARDFGFLTSQALAQRVEATLSTVEALDKWRGNLYNWYDTSTAELLEPRFVSMVDSGNFVCCLVALAQGLLEYAVEEPALGELAARVKAVADATDLAVFYNESRGLFSIGCGANGIMMDNYYDFLMSEARMAGYYAVAARQVEKRHWGMLGRTMSELGGYAGPVSWTGTMFEYYMPHLLLSAYEGSLLSESLGYCLFCQRRRVRAAKLPWGISESAYYLFDSALNYQYKAHGVQKLGVKRGLDEELVISPYSTFLTLPFCPAPAMENLRRMEKMGLYSSYGFFEAVDFTRGRAPSDYGVCRSFMAHHIGMSVVAAVNALEDGKMQKRFMRDERMYAARELLQERVKSDAVVYDNLHFKDMKEREPVRSVIAEEYDTIRPQSPQLTLLSNGALQSVLADTGASWLMYGGGDVTRRTEDMLRAPQGVFAFLDVGRRPFSLTQAPVYDPAVRYRVEFLASGMLYKAKHREIKTGVRVLLHPTLPCEQREYQMKNTGKQKLSAGLLLYFEPVLAPDTDYRAHPAFSKLFVTAEYDQNARVLVFGRRQRTGGEGPFVATGFLEDVVFGYETRRERLMCAPDGMEGLTQLMKLELEGGRGVPDAACAMRVRLTLPPGGRVRLTQIISVGRTREEAVSGIATLRAQGRVTQATAPHNPLLGDTLEGRLAFSLLPQLFFAGRNSRENDAARRQNTLGRPGLWALGISGDRPIVLVPAEAGANEEQAGLYFSLYRKCKLSGAAFDLIFTMRSVTQPNTEEILRECAVKAGCGGEIGSGVFFVELSGREEAQRTLLYAAAVHIAPKSGARVGLPQAAFLPMSVLPVAPMPKEKLGSGFETEGGTFVNGVFWTAREVAPPRLPFSHVLANPTFGTLVSDTSLGYTWAVNARENKLTPWQNDIAAGNGGERLLVRGGTRVYDVINGARAGFSPQEARYEGVCEEFCSSVSVKVAKKGCVKRISLTLRNNAAAGRPVTVAYYTEPVLGVERKYARLLVPGERDGVLTVRAPYQTDVPGVMGMMCSEKNRRAIFDRADFLCGHWEGGEACASVDPCAAFAAMITLPPHGETTVEFRLAWAVNEDALVKLIYLPLKFGEKIDVPLLSSPSPALDAYWNGFAPHQVLQCRVWGRTAFYQCGGAYGFRDQLQDVCACLSFAPRTAKYQLLRAAAAQFPQGDVLHWWHNLPKSGGGLRGVRTRYSDDLLWLPYAVCEYVEFTGDKAILDTGIPYVQAQELADDEHERYLQLQRGGESGSLYEHCGRAIERAWRLGAHSLPLMGCGDWNDGMNNVGAKGEGESVWLAMFLSMVLRRFAPLARARGDEKTASGYERRAQALLKAVDEFCWDGAWYLRAFYDSGAPMGTHANTECSIDALPQSFAVLCGMPDKVRVETALDSAQRYLADDELHLVRLFRGAFAASEQEPGYVKAYPPGVRENGGQYTHAGVWLAMALLQAGRTDEGWRLLDWLNPAARCANAALSGRYLLEPYAMAADIYTNENAPGRGGWSLYTGAAAWYFRTVLHELLGLRVHGDTAEFHPRLPAGWDGFTLELPLHGTRVRLTVKRGAGTTRLTVNGKECACIPLCGGRKEAVLELGEETEEKIRE